ncbi:hypothetical protein CEXT_233101 [Caerostris extrusa]|uniref:Uncharacterized protein n=1 Tax=Caerostris extrusa TaxID=172846 RepID=A0AAV4XNY2_CAEEX|nr:hypothetical protein CEXT_233101 [Caerostris extrusa]
MLPGAVPSAFPLLPSILFAETSLIPLMRGYGICIMNEGDRVGERGGHGFILIKNACMPPKVAIGVEELERGSVGCAAVESPGWGFRFCLVLAFVFRGFELTHPLSVVYLAAGYCSL